MENCSLDLCLSPMTCSLQSCRRDSNVNEYLAIRSKEISAIYSGKRGEYDLVEIQIREIIEKARKEGDIMALELAPVRRESPLGFSVKRSVERFLEKRKKRSKTVTPYNYNHTSSTSSSHNF